MKRYGLVMILVLALGMGAWYWTRPQPFASPPEPDPGLTVERTVPDFMFMDQTGRAFGAPHLAGQVWIANFIFTRCAATCQAQTAELERLAAELKRRNLQDRVKLVSFTLDPEHDRPSVLAEFAAEYHADSDQWKFLTGDRATVWKLGRDTFRLPIRENLGTAATPITHSPGMALIDPQGLLRAEYAGLEGEVTQRILGDVDRILKEQLYFPKDVVTASTWVDGLQAPQSKALEKAGIYCDFQFTDRRIESGIRFRQQITDDSGFAFKAVHYDHGNGLAIADVDGDGLIDIYFVNQAGPNALWRNRGAGQFEDVTAAAGVAAEGGVNVSASFADIDNDGDADLYVTKVRLPNLLFENDGTGRFREISHQAGVDHAAHSSSAVFFDYDRDGLLDLFLACVGKYTTEDLASSRAMPGLPAPSVKYYVGVKDGFAGHLKPERIEQSRLFRNLGGSRFADVSAETKLVNTGWAGDASPLDANDDGWPDLYVLNMQGNDAYYENQAGKAFLRKTNELFPKTPWGSMGIKVFDYNTDGRLDLYVTDMHSDMSQPVGPDREHLKSEMKWPESFLQSQGRSIFGNALFENLGGGRFKEVSDLVGAENYWPWGISVEDVNADGRPDVFVTQSMNFPLRYCPNSLLFNNAGHGFLNGACVVGIEPRPRDKRATPWFVLDCSGTDRNHPACKDATGRSVAWGSAGTRASVIFDLDNDGDLDIVTSEFGAEPQVLISNLSERQPRLHYLTLKLVGSASNRSGLGARVTVVTGGSSQVQVHDGKSGYLSQSLAPLYFGLGSAERVDRLEIVWPSGTKQIITKTIPVKGLLEVREP